MSDESKVLSKQIRFLAFLFLLLFIMAPMLIVYFLFPATLSAFATFLALTNPLAAILVPLALIGLIGAFVGVLLLAIARKYSFTSIRKKEEKPAEVPEKELSSDAPRIPDPGPSPAPGPSQSPAPVQSSQSQPVPVPSESSCSSVPAEDLSQRREGGEGDQKTLSASPSQASPPPSGPPKARNHSGEALAFLESKQYAQARAVVAEGLQQFPKKESAEHKALLTLRNIIQEQVPASSSPLPGGQPPAPQAEPESDFFRKQRTASMRKKKPLSSVSSAPLPAQPSQGDYLQGETTPGGTPGGGDDEESKKLQKCLTGVEILLKGDGGRKYSTASERIKKALDGYSGSREGVAYQALSLLDQIGTTRFFPLGEVGVLCVRTIDEERRRSGRASGAETSPKSKIAAKVFIFVKEKKEADQCIINLVESLSVGSSSEDRMIIPENEQGKQAYLFFLELAQMLVPGENDKTLSALYQQFSGQMDGNNFKDARVTMGLIRDNLQAKAALVVIPDSKGDGAGRVTADSLRPKPVDKTLAKLPPPTSSPSVGAPSPSPAPISQRSSDH